MADDLSPETSGESNAEIATPASTSEAWRRHLNRPFATLGSDLQSAIDRETTAFGAEFINCPHIDVDPNIGLSLLMGLTDKLTVRREELSKVIPVDKISPEAINTHLLEAIEYAQSDKDHEGKPKRPENRMAVVLRFPNTHKNGRRFNDTHGVQNMGNCLEIPVILDIRPPLEEWKASDLAYEDDRDAPRKAHNQKADLRARECGFADARSMQNSRPLALNNFWLRLNEDRAISRQKLLTSRKKERIHLERELASERATLSEFEAKLAMPLPSEKEMADAKELAAFAREDIIKIRASLTEAHTEEARARKNADKSGKGRDEEVMMWGAEIRSLNKKLGQAQRVYTMSNEKTPEFVAKKRSAWETVVAYREERITRLEVLLSECNKQMEELQSEKIDTHVYASTDRNPTLVTLKVLAADPQSYIYELEKDPDEPLTGRPKAVQRMYKNLYERALDDKPNGWLGDAISRHPDNYYTKATHRYFEYMRTQDTATMPYESLQSFAENPESSLGTAITRLHHCAQSTEAHAAEQRARKQEQSAILANP